MALTNSPRISGLVSNGQSSKLLDPIVESVLNCCSLVQRDASQVRQCVMAGLA